MHQRFLHFVMLSVVVPLLMSIDLVGIAWHVDEPITLAAAQGARMLYDEVAAERGLQEPDTVTRSAAWEDFDRDGHLDVVFANLFYPNRIYRNNGNGTFRDVSAEWGIDQQLIEDTYGVIVADYDNDGDGDIFFTNGGFNSLGVNRLYRNDLNTLGRFTEVTSLAGLLDPPAFNHAAAWLDYDRDGWLDLVVSRRNAPISLYRNLGHGTFVDVADSVGLRDVLGGANGICPADFDNDGYPDILLPILRVADLNYTATRLFRNQSDGTFSEVTQVVGLGGPPTAFTCAVDDFNQDGWLDIYVATFAYDKDPIKVASVLYLNNGGKGEASFSPANSDSGVYIASNIMGLQSGDLNNDGFPEIFIGRGDPDVGTPSMLLANMALEAESPKFLDVSAQTILQIPPDRTHGINFVDFDRDGDIDIFVGNGGNMPTCCADPPCDLPGQEGPKWLFLARPPAGVNGNWLRYRLTGVVSNRDAIGSRLVIETNKRVYYAHISGGNGFDNMNPLEKLMGVGDATQVRAVWINWPSGIVQRILTPELGQTYLWSEIGMVASALTEVGAINVRVAGPRGALFEVYASTERIDSPLQAGVRLLAGPPFMVRSGHIGASNLEIMDIPVPVEFRDGRPLYMQTVMQLGGEIYISNLVSLTFD